MTGTQKARLRKIAKQIEALKAQAEEVLGELDEYVSDHQDTLDGTARGEKLDGEIDAVFALGDSFEMLHTEILEITN